MATIPWLSGPQTESGLDTSIVMASRFELRSARKVIPFLFAALRVHRQVRRADGAIGVSLIARPLSREFYTLSAWRDRAAIDTMIQLEPHRSVMTAFRSQTVDAKFTFWKLPTNSRPTWKEAHDRLAREDLPPNADS